MVFNLVQLWTGALTLVQLNYPASDKLVPESVLVTAFFDQLFGMGQWARVMLSVLADFEPNGLFTAHAWPILPKTIELTRFGA